MNLLHLRYFFEVARMGSFSRAARTLRVSQPALSQTVSLLEDAVGKKLLERSTRAMSLTSAGEKLFASATLIFDEVKRAEETLNGEDRALRGEWGLALSDNLANYFAPSVLTSFKKDNPELRMHVFSGTSHAIQEELLADRSQLGLLYTPPKQAGAFVIQEVGRTEFWIVVHPKFSSTGGRLTLSKLRQGTIPRIESRHRDYGDGFPAHFHSRKQGLTHAPWLEVNTHETKKHLVLNGAGYALLIRESVQDAVRIGALTRVATTQPLVAPVFAIWKRSRPLSEASRRFLDAWKSQSGLH